MKYIWTITIIILTFSATIYSQVKLDSQIIRLDSINVRTNIDTLKVQVTLPKNSNGQDSKPWVIALVVGILAFVGTIIASYINKLVSIKGINNTKDIAIKQIENSQELARHEFNATLKTKNRQEWVNEFRNTLSEFASNCVRLNTEFQDQDLNSKEKIKAAHEKVTFTRTKIRLLLNHKKELHTVFSESLIKFVNILDEHVVNYRNPIQDYKNFDFQKCLDKVINDARDLLYDEWKEIQKLTKPDSKLDS